MENSFKNIKKIGVISDTHIPSRARALPAKIYDIFKGADFIIHCGDLVSNDVKIGLSSIAPFYGVKGNMDPRDVDFPGQRIFTVNEKICICAAHGSGTRFGLKEKIYKRFCDNKPNIIIFGHSHSPLIEKINNVTMLNPGSATGGLDYNSVAIIKLNSFKFDCEIIRLD